MYEAVFRVDCVRMPGVGVGMGFQCGRIDFKVKAAAAGMGGVHVPSLAGTASAPPRCCAPLLRAERRVVRHTSLSNERTMRASRRFCSLRFPRALHPEASLPE